MKYFERMFYVTLICALLWFMIQYHPVLLGKIMIGIGIAVAILLSCLNA